MNENFTERYELFSSIVGEKNVIVGSTPDKYSYNDILDLNYPYDFVLKPSCSEEVSQIMKFCNENFIPVTPRGGGSGVTGGALALRRGVILSMEKMVNPIELNLLDETITVGSGVLTNDMCEKLYGTGYFFPPVPTSSNMSFVGGNVAVNAGSTNSCKYGTTADYVLNLEVVLANGDIIWTGSNVRKDTAGLNLTQLFTGSEGILGIITKIVYRIIRAPKFDYSLLLGFKSSFDSYQFVSELKKTGILPSAVEWVGPDALNLARNYFDKKFPLSTDEVHNHLIVKIEADQKGIIESQTEEIFELSKKYSENDILIAFVQKDRERIWSVRNNLGAALTSGGKRYRDIDITLPFSKVPEYLDAVEIFKSKYSLNIVVFGHIWDGNLHTMIMEEKEITTNYSKGIRELYLLAISLGGSITGEHGIGMLQKDLLVYQFEKTNLEIMKKIREIFDPRGILNIEKSII